MLHNLSSHLRLLIHIQDGQSAKGCDYISPRVCGKLFGQYYPFNEDQGFPNMQHELACYTEMHH